MSDRISILKKMLVQEDTDAFLNHALGLEYLKINDLTVAKNYFFKVISNHPDYIGTYYHLAKTLWALNQKSTAIKIFEDGIGIAKKNNNLKALQELQSEFETLLD